MLFSFFVGLMTVVLVLDCLFLILLILIQLPKKEAGLGQAFGSGTTDALFGAGSGNALTKMTRYAAVVFFVLVFILSIVNAQKSRARKEGNLGKIIEQNKVVPAQTVPAPPATNAPMRVTPLNLTNTPAPITPAPAAPAAAATNK